MWVLSISALYIRELILAVSAHGTPITLSINEAFRELFLGLISDRLTLT